MASHIHPSALSPATPGSVIPPVSTGSSPTPPCSPFSSVPGEAMNVDTEEASSSDGSSQGGSLAAFICHAAYLEAQLQKDDPTASFDGSKDQIVGRKRIGQGTSFAVDRAELLRHTGADVDGQYPLAKYVAVKTARGSPRGRTGAKDGADEAKGKNKWRDILFEVRVLLHEPIRYHPNVVRLLGIRWEASSETDSPLPSLVVELAEFGTLFDLQWDRPSLPFSVRQKLCYDVGRGLSILHACGIVHGDLKHENVLVFANPYNGSPPGQPYTAKLADFGGTLTDVAGSEDAGRLHHLPMGTFPFEAPEVGQKLSAAGVKKADAYSYGMLIWRCMIDCSDMFGPVGGAVPRVRVTDEQRRQMNGMKGSDALLELAISKVEARFREAEVPAEGLQLVVAALESTIRGDPDKRALDRAQACMRGTDTVAAGHYVALKDRANAAMIKFGRQKSPGKHGMSMDTVGYGLGRLGDDYDAQNNLPGYRPELPHPVLGGFLFEPHKLRLLLGWEEQAQMVHEFRAAANASASAAELPPCTAAFYLFQSCLAGFGMPVNAQQACYWLRAAASPTQGSAGLDHLAKAWCYRLHSALETPSPQGPHLQKLSLRQSIVRGHRHCSWDFRALCEEFAGRAIQEGWMAGLREAELDYRTSTGATGVPYFAQGMLRGPWVDMGDVAKLDEHLKEELGAEYEGCLRRLDFGTYSVAGAVAAHPAATPPDGGHRLDKICVNDWGHGLLHLAASFGKDNAIAHILGDYLCDINLPSRSNGETPLLCACRSGNLTTAMLLLGRGANPNGGERAEEAPLHCLFNFGAAEMRAVVGTLLRGGADLERLSGGGGGGLEEEASLYRVPADWEGDMRIPATPLARAVLRQDVDAVEILLEHGADPLGKGAGGGDGKSAVELAAVLTLPDLLDMLLRAVDKRHHADVCLGRRREEDAPHVLDEKEMLEAAQRGTVTGYDTTTLQSRLVRCGSGYKKWMALTLRLLRERRKAALAKLEDGADDTERSRDARALYHQVWLGNTDIVEALLDLGYPVEGSVGFRPIEAAVLTNNAEMFKILASRDSPLIFAEYRALGWTLLHALASKLQQTPAGLSIARHLIASGVAVESQDVRNQRGPGALALAVMGGYFDLAEMLISNGAGRGLNDFAFAAKAGMGVDVGVDVGVDGDATTTTLLGKLLEQHSAPRLEGISYLAELHGRQDRGVEIDPVVHKPSGLTAVHMLALVAGSGQRSDSPPRVSDRIAQTVLAMFPDGASLGGGRAVHPRFGTPLAVAVAAADARLVRALLRSGHAADLDRAAPCAFPAATTAAALGLLLRRPDACRVAGPITPRFLALAIAQSAMAAFEEAVESARAGVASPASATASASSSSPSGDAPPAATPVSAEDFAVLRRQVEIACMVALPADVASVGGMVPGLLDGVDPWMQPSQFQTKLREFQRIIASFPYADPAEPAGPAAPKPRHMGFDDGTIFGDGVSTQAAARSAVATTTKAAGAARDRNLPVDLSVLTEERPSEREEGDEMSSLRAQRILLNDLRGADGGFGDPIHGLLDKTFNNRKRDGHGSSRW